MDLTDEMQLQAKALADSSRFRLFRFISEADGPVGVAELTELLGFNHNAIRQHLAVLVDTGLVAETVERRTTRGRPRKQYAARADALSAFRSVSGAYERLASLLLGVAAGVPPYEVGFVAAGGGGDPGEADAAAGIHGLIADLAEEGFEPCETATGELSLMYCPFAGVAAQNQGIVCELHRGLIDGRLAARTTGLVADLVPRDPHDAGCRVSLRSSVAAAGQT